MPHTINAHVEVHSVTKDGDLYHMKGLLRLEERETHKYEKYVSST